MNVIRVLDAFEVRRMDSLNWRVWQYRRIEGGKREGEYDWVGLESYHSSLRTAVEAIARIAPRETCRGVDADLQGAIEIMRDIEREIGGHARAFEAAMKEGK